MIKKILSRTALLGLSVALLGLSSCDDDFTDRTEQEIAEEMQVDVLPAELIKVRDYVPNNAVIAHRGSTFWVPEETEVAYQWARNLGVDYLELDIQKSSDGVLLALHDNNLQRTSDIQMIYPDREDAFAYDLTYKELMKLDAGAWFNTSSPNQARPGFVGQEISTLEDVFMIANGYRVKRDADGKRVYQYDKDAKVKYTFEYEVDPYDNGNRPGVYIEFKEAWMYPNIEQETYDLMDRLGWNIITKPSTDTEPFKNGKVNVANTNGKVILQTFSKQSLQTSAEVFKGQIPMCFLLWLGDGFLLKDASPQSYADAINYGVKNKAHFTGPSIAGAPNYYDDILQLWQANMTHRAQLKIHAYSFDTPEQMKKYYGDRFGNPSRPLTDAMFTNRSEATIQFYIDKEVRPKGIMGNDKTPQQILDELGFLTTGGNGR